MSKIINLKKTDLANIVTKVIKEQNNNDFEPESNDTLQGTETNSDNLNLGQKFSDDLSGDLTFSEDGEGQNYVIIKNAFTDNPEIVAIIPKD